MSLIESAIEKMRRARGAVADLRIGHTSAPTSSLAGKTSASPAAPTRRLSVDLEALRTAGYLPEAGCERRFADQYRQIKRPIIEKAMSDLRSPQLRLLMVTSALAGDGKTFTSINLSLSLARERDISVLLVDADVPNPNIGRIFAMERERGLLDALADESVDVATLIRSTSIPGLDVLPAGNPVDHAAERLASARMAQIAARLGANPSCIVVLDSAPLLLSSESRALAKLVGQIALVTRAGKTPQHAVLDAIGQIDANRLSGIILNDSNVEPTTRYYHYGSYGTEGAESGSAG